MNITTTIENNTYTVTEPCSVHIELIADEALAVGDTIEFQFSNSWCLVNGPSFTREFQTEDAEGEHYVAVRADDTHFSVEVTSNQLNDPGTQSRHGRLMTATLTRGSVPAGTPVCLAYENTFAPYVSEVETVWISVKSQVADPFPTLKVKPHPHTYIRVLAPSCVKPNQAFDVRIVSLDEFDNASNSEFHNGTLVLDDGTVVADDLDFCGMTKVKTSRPKEGIVRFRFNDTLSNAVRVSSTAAGPYWGDIHIHTKISSDAQGRDPYNYARNVSALDFAGVTDHNESMGPGGYDIVERWAEEAYEPGRFVTILADERNPKKLTGHHNIYFRDVEAFRQHAALPGKAPKEDIEEEAEYLKTLDPDRVMLIPHHTGINFRRFVHENLGSAVQWDAWDDPGLRPTMEIYSHHGQSDVWSPQHILAYEFNRMRNSERRANVSRPGPHYAQDYWMAGQRLRVIASSDEHSGQGGRRHGGIAAVRTPELTREGIFDAIRDGHCYATTGERILVDFTVNETNMGGELQCSKEDTLSLKLDVWATDLIVRVEILRFRFGVDSRFHTVLAEVPRPETTDASYELKETCTGPCLFYARVTQEPLVWPGMAWTSPIWVDVK